MNIRLIAATNVDPIDLASHAAKTCYSATTPELGSKIDVENRLYKTGHHSTLEHTYFTFEIEGIAVGDVDFGLHLTTPHYNTDQRSGRYAKMFEDPNAASSVLDYIKEIYPEIKQPVLKQISDYVSYCLSIFHENQESATSVCLGLHESERPYLTESLKKNMAKLAQEQLRSFIPVIVPTGLDYTVDIIALAELYHSAWSPAMVVITDMMASAVLEVYPSLGFIFENRKVQTEDFPIKIASKSTKIVNSPSLKLISIESPAGFVVPPRGDKHPIDLTTTHPKYMDNEVGSYMAEVECTIVTYGQDQRHRANRRSLPVLTGNFLLSPMLAEMKLEDEAMKVMDMLSSLSGLVPDALLVTLAPYGATLKYYKRGSLNSLAHEASKRLCFCAQAEIYEMMRQFRLQVEANANWHDYLSFVEPPCMNGPCAEPDRYCGRDMKDKKNYFPPRSV